MANWQKAFIPLIPELEVETFRRGFFSGDYHAQRHINLILEFFRAGLKAILEIFLG